jgi:2-desacetyl-2-hydroxyethyl bacteriochlorophyllide A dehydrogenase
MSRTVESSIIIRAFNEERCLPGLLEAIRAQAYQSFEILVVDSGSYDRTPEIVERFGAKLIRIASRDFTFGYSLNVGIRHSLGHFLTIVSAHTKPLDAHWLEKLIEPLRQRDTAMVYGRQVGAPESNFSEGQDFNRTFGPEPRLLTIEACFANNANSAIRRELWDKHPFDEALPGLEDIEWARYWVARGQQIFYEPNAAVYHIHQETWRQIRRRYYREAMAAKWMGLKGRRHIPLEMARESTRFLGDLVEAGRQGRLRAEAHDIAMFRMRKVLGTIHGLADGAVMQDPRKRDAVFFDRTYRAVVVHRASHAALDERDLPEIKPGDVLIRTAYVGVCATDLEVFHGTLDYYRTGRAVYPIVPGHEFSGTVVTVGPNVQHLQPGDLVVAECIQGCGECNACKQDNGISCNQRRELGVLGKDGAYAEYVVIPGRFVHKLPETLDLKTAVLCEPVAVVLKGLRRLGQVCKSGSIRWCGVVGAGPLGYLCAQVLAHQGHEVTVFDRNPDRLNAFHQPRITPAQTGSPSGLHTFDVLVEATGDPNALETLLCSSRPGAVLLLLGLPYGKREFSFEQVVAYDKMVIGSVGSSAADMVAAIHLLPQLPVTPLLEHVLPLEQYAQAWDLVKSRKPLKVLLRCEA